METLAAGLSAEVAHVVAEGDTATALHSGDVNVLGTPRVVALCEEATVRAIEGRLDPGLTSVGTRVEVDHLRATAVGGRLLAEAVLEEAAGRKLLFSVSVSDADGRVAVGRIVRVVVERDRFLAAV
jgi:predicted thioesterase